MCIYGSPSVHIIPTVLRSLHSPEEVVTAVNHLRQLHAQDGISKYPRYLANESYPLTPVVGSRHLATLTG